jgi:ribosomal-protein-alanine N-acetyltransferase
MLKKAVTLPQFETKRLLLREVGLADAPSYEKNFVDYEVVRHMSAAIPWPYPKDGIAPFLEQHVVPKQGRDKWMWGLFLKENPSELIGVVDVWREPRPENRGFWLGRRHWGQGLMTEALEPVMDYVFNELGFEKLILSNAVGNRASRRIKEKTGSRLMGVEPAKFIDPVYTEHELWELRKEDWFRGRKR